MHRLHPYIQKEHITPNKKDCDYRAPYSYGASSPKKTTHPSKNIPENAECGTLCGCVFYGVFFRLFSSKKYVIFIFCQNLYIEFL